MLFDWHKSLNLWCVYWEAEEMEEKSALGQQSNKCVLSTALSGVVFL